MSVHREQEDDVIAAVRCEAMSMWGGHRDVWAISVQADDRGEPFVLISLGDDAAPFPDVLRVQALDGRAVPLRTEVVGKIVPL
ncbi:hypothetical protein pkur_cds_310 [Pandoravirus kuranda]|nr:hypothetical protein pkur_cds_310 [Pandoravirus kuranda]